MRGFCTHLRRAVFLVKNGQPFQPALIVGPFVIQLAVPVTSVVLDFAASTGIPTSIPNITTSRWVLATSLAAANIR